MTTGIDTNQNTFAVRKRGCRSNRLSKLIALLTGAGARTILTGIMLFVVAEASGGSIAILRFEPESNLCRAGRAESVTAVIGNGTQQNVVCHPRFIWPEGVRGLPPQPPERVEVLAGKQAVISCRIQADAACVAELVLEVEGEGDDGMSTAETPLRVCFLPPLAKRELDAIPAPEPVQTDILVGAHHCPIWESDRSSLSRWSQVINKHPERKPALGFYSQENPEVADWETKWAVEHGISYFIYCWYRKSQGGPVQTRFSSAIHEALLKSQFADRMKFTIMWENQARGTSGVADEKDLFDNLLPFWMENYFKHPSYLKIDNKPVLFIYRPEFLVKDLGSVENVVNAFDKMRQTCRNAGFAGLYILGEYRGTGTRHLKHMKKLGLDYTFAYCWSIPDNPTPEQAIVKQMEYIRKTQELNILPQVVTVSQAWSGWRDEGSIWKIPPSGFETLLRQAKDFIGTLPANELGSRMLILDNWNEWSEGHYIAPYREYGFGYLDAVRNVFARNPEEPHVDLIPEDIGMGPYDTAINALIQHDQELKRLSRKQVLKIDPPEDGLVGWWTFDENGYEPVTADYSGNKRGGVLLEATRAPGKDGNALVCTGGCLRVESDPAFSVTTGLTVTCWVKTDKAGQNQAWIVNRIQSGGVSTGYRLGIMNGCPCFNVPQTPWSHTASATNALPIGRWVHLAGTCDGQTVRIYMDGVLCGTLPRLGPIGGNSFPLILGSFAAVHSAHFNGLLDEVRLYSRALTPQEISRQCE